MPGRRPLGRKERVVFRVDDLNARHIATQAKKHGTTTNYLNWLVTLDRTGRDEAFTSRS